MKKTVLFIFITVDVVIAAFIAFFIFVNKNEKSAASEKNEISEEAKSFFHNGRGANDSNPTDMESGEERPSDDKEEETEKAVHDTEEILKEYLVDLYSEYGVLKLPQKGRMTGQGDKWLDPKGIIYGGINDFDNDGNDELLVVRTEKRSLADVYIEGTHPLIMEMYEADGESVEKSDSINFEPFLDSSNYNGPLNFYLVKAMWEEIIYGLSLADIDGEKVLLCEGNLLASYFGDGSHRSYWGLQYKKDSFRYVLSFPQGFLFGSDGFFYLGYEFSNGNMTDSKIYYSEYEDDALYGDFSQAIKAYFGKHGITVSDEDFFSSVYRNDKNVVPLFTLVNRGFQKEYDMPVDYVLEDTASDSNSEYDTGNIEEENQEKTGSGDFILPESASRYYSRNELLPLNRDELRIARNEIYARHGRAFKDDGLRAYFMSKDWYVPRREEIPESELNDYEKANCDLIKEMEDY